MNLEALKFPIGKYSPNKNPSSVQIEQWITEIGAFPNSLVETLSNVPVQNLSWQYRPDGWTIKQVVHHCADSHMNSIIRFKLALTENTPTIRPYFEQKWAELPDSLEDDIQPSLTLLKGLHQKLEILLRSLTPNQLQLEFEHPEHGEIFNLAETIGTYAWHSNHHLAHVKQALASDGQY
jgi:hypothetical protein